MQNTSATNKTLVRIIFQGILYFITYLKKIPLTFLLVEIFGITTIITVKSPLEIWLIKLVAFTLRLNESNFQISTNKVIVFFAIWNIPVTLIVNILRKIIRIRVNKLVIFGVIIFVLLVVQIYIAFIINSILIPAIWFIFSILNLFLFYFLSSYEKRIVGIIEFITKTHENPVVTE